MTAGETTSGELVGKVLGGRYRVTATLGRGGMGVVGRAVDELLHREVAVKILRAYTDASAPELAGLRTRMQREAQAAARIRHSGVVTVFDVIDEQGLPVIVMELVDGPSLDDVLAERGTIDPREAAAIGAKLTDSLDAAHRAGVLHRDVKPGNVLLERGGRVVLTDFGIASMEATGDEALAKLTRGGELIGSLDYLPPERAQGREPGPASDIWSLGMTLYAAVEGASPFRRTSVLSTLTAIVTEPLPEPRRAGPLAPVLRALMAKEPERRPSAERAREMLDRVAGDKTVNLNAKPPAPQPAPPLAPAAVPPVAPSGPRAAGSVPYQQPAPPSARAGYTPPGQPRTLPLPDAPPAGGGTGGRSAAAARARRRNLAIGAAAAAVVLVGGGVAYALMGQHGGASDVRGSVAMPSFGIPPGSASPSARPSASASARRTAAHTAHPPTAAPADSRRAAPTKRPGGGTAGKPTPHPTAKPTTVSTSCGGWSHDDPAPGTYGYMTGSYHIESGPYESCPSVALASSGTKLWYQCYVVNAYGKTWTYVRIAGTETAGWMSNDNLTGQKGPSTHC